MGQVPAGCLALAGCLVPEASAARAPHTSIRSGVQRARCCGRQAVEGRLIKSPPPTLPHSVPRGDPHPSLPPGAPSNSLPHLPSSPPLAAKVHLGGTEPCGRGSGGGRCAFCTLTDTHRWRLRGLHAGSGARLPRSSSELSAHTRARSRPLIHTPALSSAGPPEGPGLHLPRHHPTPEPGLGHFRLPPPIPRLECEVWHCVAPDTPDTVGVGRKRIFSNRATEGGNDTKWGRLEDCPTFCLPYCSPGPFSTPGQLVW